MINSSSAVGMTRRFRASLFICMQYIKDGGKEILSISHYFSFSFFFYVIQAIFSLLLFIILIFFYFSREIGTKQRSRETQVGVTHQDDWLMRRKRKKRELESNLVMITILPREKMDIKIMQIYVRRTNRISFFSSPL